MCPRDSQDSAHHEHLDEHVEPQASQNQYQYYIALYVHPVLMCIFIYLVNIQALYTLFLVLFVLRI